LFAKSATIASTALSIPRFKSIGLLLQQRFSTFFTILVKTVAVVVPSPAKSLVLEATSLPFELPCFLMGLSIQFLLQ
jgi:hypothetical protein